MNLKDERRDADALGPLLWDPLFEADARAQAKKSVGLIEAVGYSQHLEGAFDDEMRVVGELKADGVMKAFIGVPRGLAPISSSTEPVSTMCVSVWKTCHP